ncbi:hypothetical protein RvY_03582 [Ramazzottius varieornatus]|uniref:Uncharacterized protein n=1 Tax=Ramazzottius varieornatus TaxID=947166 RepID=A0A1D1UNM0_RAMVA|nr:hypothetical protein RvY_03582 [Ramazzottius varieornatus]
MAADGVEGLAPGGNGADGREMAGGTEPRAPRAIAAEGLATDLLVLEPAPEFLDLRLERLEDLRLLRPEDLRELLLKPDKIELRAMENIDG